MKFELDLKSGRHVIEREPAQTLFNLMGPNWIDGPELMDYISPPVFQDFDNYTDNYRFIPLGIKSVEVVER